MREESVNPLLPGLRELPRMMRQGVANHTWFGVCGLGIGVWGLAFGVWRLEFGV